jgi:hypothetical protein
MAMTPRKTLLHMSHLTLRSRGQWPLSGRRWPSVAEIDRAVNACADLLRGDDMPDLITLAHIESVIKELKTYCGCEV